MIFCGRKKVIKEKIDCEQKNKKDIKKVVIVGNGFDISHDLKTRYIDFLNSNYEIKEINDFKILVDELNNESEEKLNWNDIEQCMKKIALSIYDKNFYYNMNSEKYSLIENKMNEVNKLYKKITELFMYYLKNNVMKKDIKINDSIKEEFDTNTIAINFNYTNTIRHYTNNVKYIHGSIEEDNYIVLGFFEDTVPDSCTGEYSMYRKDVQREILNFIRFLKENRYESNEELLEEFKQQIYCLYSGRGEYLINTTDLEISGFRKNIVSREIIEYARLNNFEVYAEKVDYNSVEEIVIIGHSLKSDQNYFYCLRDKMPMLKRITLFNFKGESIYDICEKKRAIHEFFGNIKVETKYY